MAAQVETGHLCPLTMTRAAFALLAAEPALRGKIAAKIPSRNYEGAFRPWWEKAGMTLGMGMTETQGGTDVRANTTRAPDGDGYTIVGAKWFMSAPMTDAFLILAQAPGGLTCFLMPRFRPDGTVNALALPAPQGQARQPLQCLERSGIRRCLCLARRRRRHGHPHHHADGAIDAARLRRGVGGLMRMALAQAVHHCRYRNVFGKRLIEQPMMRTVLADMALDVEAAVALVVRLSRALDHAATDPREAAYARLLTPAAKFWTCKLAPGFIFEAMESLGGNGYVEESILPRLYREGPVNAIWEGSGNVMCLDVLRALKGKDESELLAGLARDAGLSADAEFPQSASEAQARRLVLRLALSGVHRRVEGMRAVCDRRHIFQNARRKNACRLLRRGGYRFTNSRSFAPARVAGGVTALLTVISARLNRRAPRGIKLSDLR